ncbi:MAG: FkbM family methyltransferase [Acidobacteria bacterium]|nr:FkbM family methyltransferase [Acidobacteriota bacterium]
MKLRDMSAFIYRALVTARHPEALSLRRRGIDYEHFRNLRRRWLLDAGVNTVLDIGANTGQFARLAHAVLPAAAIYSFEPLPDCFASLTTALPGVAHFHPINCALGAEDGTLEFRRAAHTPSSSFLPMTSLHREAFPESAAGQEERTVSVAVRRLDDAARELPLRDNILVKIDVQGYEAQVLAGGAETVRRAVAVIMETSYVKLYEGQALFEDVYRAMLELGFDFQGNMEQMVSPADGRIVQADAVFVRRDRVER